MKFKLFLTVLVDRRKYFQVAADIEKIILFLFISFFLCLAGCTVPGGTEAPDTTESFSSWVTSLAGSFSSLEDGEDTGGTPLPDSVTIEPDTTDPGIVSYTITRYKVGQTFDELAILNPQTTVIYPGAVLIGESIPTGAYTQVTGGVRKPVNISTSLVGGSAVSAAINNPDSLAEVRTGVNNLLLEAGSGSLVSTIIYEETTVHSETQLQLAVGANYSYSGAASVEIEADFEYGTDNSDTEILIKFMQVYYTVDVDAISLDNFYSTAPDLSSLGSVTPVYVASLAYGRLAYLSIKSSHSELEIKAALDASFEYARHAGSVQIDAAYQNILDSASYNVTIMGSNDSTAIGGYNDFVAFLMEDEGYSIHNPGSPVAYTLKYVKDNSIASVLLYSEYTVRQANFAVDFDPNSLTGKYEICVDRMGLSSGDDSGDHGEIFGNIFVWGMTNTYEPIADILTLMSLGESDAVSVKENISISTFNSYGGTSTDFRTTVDFAEGTKGNNQIYIAAYLDESDPGSNNEFQDKSFYVDLAAVETACQTTGSYSKYFSVYGDGNSLHVHYTITRK